MLVLLILIFEQNSDLKKICMYVKFDQEVLNTSKINRNDKIFINKKKNKHPCQNIYFHPNDIAYCQTLLCQTLDQIRKFLLPIFTDWNHLHIRKA